MVSGFADNEAVGAAGGGGGGGGGAGLTFVLQAPSTMMAAIRTTSIDHFILLCFTFILQCEETRVQKYFCATNENVTTWPKANLF
jgi:hypothetical protein